MYQRGWLKFFFFFLSFSFLVLVFGFWFFNCRVTRVARGVLWVGVGVHYTTWGKVLPSTGLHYRYMLPFFLLMRWEEGWKGGRRHDAFAENREPTEICHCWPEGGFFVFVFYEVGWLVVLLYLT